MKTTHRHGGFTILELMVAITIGLIVLIGLVQIIVQNQAKYAVTTGQGETQNAELTLQSVLGTALRGAGFFGCSSNTTANFVANINSMMNTGAYVQGYDGGASATISTLNYANDTTLTDWTPSLNSSFSGFAEKNSDVLVVVGARAGTSPVMLTSDAASGAGSLNLQSASQVVSNGYLAVSNCQQSSIVQTASATTASGNVTVQLSNGNLNQAYTTGGQAVPVAATAFFVGAASGTQSALYQAENTAGAWKVTPLIPGVNNMRIRYGIGTQANTTQYKTAAQMANTDWATVNSIQAAFLLEGNQGSTINQANCTNKSWTLLGRTVTLPCDTRLRHVFNLTVSLRNAQQ